MTVLLGDIHFGKNGFSMETYENQMKFYHKQLFPFLLQQKIKHVICTGDFFDHRTRQDVLLLLKIKKEFLKFFEDNEIMLTVLVGNHDMYFKDSKKICTLDLFEENKFLRIIKETTIIEIGNIKWQLFPWINEEGFAPKTKHIIGHFEINGFNMAGNFTCTHGMNPNSLRNMKQVISGHFHTKQENGPIKYLGTPYSLDWNDYNQEKGFYLLDDDGNLDFIENKYSMRYYEIDMKVENDIAKYFIGDLEYSYEEIENLSNNGNKIRINTTMNINVSNNSNIILNIEDSDDINENHQDINKFVKESLTENGYTEFSKLYEEILTNQTN